MSVEEQAEESVNMIKKQVKDLMDMVDQASRDRDYSTASEKLKRWKSRTVRLLSEKLSPNEGQELESMHLSSINIFDPLQNFMDEANKYETYLKALMEELEKHPEEILPSVITSAATAVQTPRPTSSKTVFVVHGRSDRLRQSMFNFLRALKLNPVEWSQAIRETKKSSPYIGEILDNVFKQAQAIIVMFSGDDEARLRKEFWRKNEPDYEKELTPQPRPNVIFEAGMAISRSQDRTILVQVGSIRSISDISGRHITMLDDSAEKRQELAEKLRIAGCEVDTTGTDWLSAGNFQDKGAL